MCFNFLFDANPAVIKDPNVPKWRRYLIIVLMIVVAALSFAAFITNTVWFTRINPWFKYGTKCKIVWLLVLIALIVFLACFVFFVIFALVGILKNKGTCCLFFLFNLLAWGGLIVGIVAYFQASKHVDYDKRFGKPVICSAPLNDSYFSYPNHATSYEQIEKYYEWYNKLKPESICQDILNPALYIEIIQFVLYIFMISFMTGCCCCHYNNESEGENDEKNNTNDKEEKVIEL